MPLHPVPDNVTELGRQTGTRDMEGTVQPALVPGSSRSTMGRYGNTAALLSTTTTAASSNYTPDAVSQLCSKSRSIQSSRSSDRQAGMIATLSVQPGLDSTSVVQSNLISPVNKGHKEAQQGMG